MSSVNALANLLAVVQIVNLDEDHVQDLIRLQKVPHYITWSALLQMSLACIVFIGTLAYALRLKNVSPRKSPNLIY